MSAGDDVDFQMHAYADAITTDASGAVKTDSHIRVPMAAYATAHQRRQAEAADPAIDAAVSDEGVSGVSIHAKPASVETPLANVG